MKETFFFRSVTRFLLRIMILSASYPQSLVVRFAGFDIIDSSDTDAMVRFQFPLFYHVDRESETFVYYSQAR